jgi:hypothetical protein
MRINIARDRAPGRAVAGHGRARLAVGAALAAGLCLSGCASSPTEPAAGPTADSASSIASEGPADTATGSAPASPPSRSGSSTAASTSSADPSKTSTQAPTALRAAGDEVLAALKAKDYQALAGLVDSQEGVRFTPYATVDVEGDVSLTPAQVARLGSDSQKYLWGADPGSGELLKMTFAKYNDKYVYDKDFLAADVVSENKVASQGSSVDNIADSYSGAKFIEYYFKGFDPQYDGMDWEALRLVFSRNGGDLALVGIVHDQWTP